MLKSTPLFFSLTQLQYIFFFFFCIYTGSHTAHFKGMPWAGTAGVTSKTIYEPMCIVVGESISLRYINLWFIKSWSDLWAHSRLHLLLAIALSHRQYISHFKSSVTTQRANLENSLYLVWYGKCWFLMFMQLHGQKSSEKHPLLVSKTYWLRFHCSFLYIL